MKGFVLGEGFWEEEEPGELQEDGGPRRKLPEAARCCGYEAASEARPSA